MYDTTIGRFLSEDPLGFQPEEDDFVTVPFGDLMSHANLAELGGDASAGNLYRYAGNNPVTNVDPSGLKICKLKPAEGICQYVPFISYVRTWELDQIEIKKLEQLNDLIRSAIELKKDLRAIRDHLPSEDYDRSVQELNALITYATEYWRAIIEFEPDVSFCASGSRFTFDFEAYEGRTPQWKLLIRAGLRGFKIGLDVGISEGANQLPFGLRRVRQIMRQRKTAEQIWNNRNRSFTRNETKLLDQFFKSKGKTIPKGLSEDVLRRYKAIAQAAQTLGKDTVGTQSIREKWIEEALKTMVIGK